MTLTKTRSIKVILFDLDDTLYLERDYVFSGFRAVADWAAVHLDIPAGIGFARLKELFEGGQRGRTFDQWLAAFGATEDGLVPQLVEVYRQHLPNIVPLPETDAALKTAGERYRLGLVSDGYLTVQQRKLAALKLASCLEVVVFSDALGRDCWKPSVKPFEAALAAFGIEGKEAVYVADNPLKDFLGARQLGLFTIQVKHPLGIYTAAVPPTPEHAPNCIISTLTELEGLLRSNS